MAAFGKGRVYLVENETDGLFKIGMTRKDPGERVAELQTGNPSRLTLKASYQTDYPYRLESMLHRLFSSKKVMNEWYRLDEDEADRFISTCETQERIILSLLGNPFFFRDGVY